MARQIRNQCISEESTVQAILSAESSGVQQKLAGAISQRLMNGNPILVYFQPTRLHIDWCRLLRCSDTGSVSLLQLRFVLSLSVCE